MILSHAKQMLSTALYHPACSFMQYKFVLYQSLLQKIFQPDLDTFSRTIPANSFRILDINLAILIKSGFDSLIVQIRNQRRISEGTSSLLSIKFKAQTGFCGYKSVLCLTCA